MHESGDPSLCVLSMKTLPTSMPTTSMMPDVTRGVHLNTFFFQGLQAELHLSVFSRHLPRRL